VFEWLLLIQENFLKPPYISSPYYSLSHNNISDSGACVLAEVLKVNQSIQKLE